MKSILIISTLIFSFLGFNNDHLSNSVWICKIGAECIDTLKFKKDKYISIYSCESDYTYKGNYTVSKDIITIIEKDDSHDEDGGKPGIYRLKFILKKNKLYPLSNEEFWNGKWVKMKEPINNNYIFSRI